MLLHYWKVGHFILFNQKLLGWGSKFIEQTSKALRELHPEKKGYSPRNLKYMCQFAKLYPIQVIEELIIADQKLQKPTLEKVLSVTNTLNEFQIRQEPPAQLQTIGLEDNTNMQEAPEQIEDVSKALAIMTKNTVSQIENYFIYSPVSKTNWASHMVLMDSKLPLGSRYWYMKQSIEFGWSSTILKIQIENDLFHRQIEKQKVSNFTATLPKPQSDLANYLLKDPYIFDLAGTKERADERDIEV